jgi:hypothetical protein
MWEKVERTKSKELQTPAKGTPMDSHPLTTKPLPAPTQPKPPAEPRSDGKPPHPYEMTPSEAQQYRWRWVEAQAANMPDPDDTEDSFFAAAYIIEVLKGMGVEDVGSYVTKVERVMAQDQLYSRRRLRIAAFKSK